MCVCSYCGQFTLTTLISGGIYRYFWKDEVLSPDATPSTSNTDQGIYIEGIHRWGCIAGSRFLARLPLFIFLRRAVSSLYKLLDCSQLTAVSECACVCSVHSPDEGGHGAPIVPQILLGLVSAHLCQCVHQTVPVVGPGRAEVVRHVKEVHLPPVIPYCQLGTTWSPRHLQGGFRQLNTLI